MSESVIPNLETILNIVRLATRRDNKPVPIRILKCMEELGELAQAALRYERVDAWSEKTATLEDLQEEAADVLIVVLSILLLLGEDEVLGKALAKANRYYTALVKHNPGPL